MRMLAVLLGALLASALANDAWNPHVVSGLTHGDLLAKWWQWSATFAEEDMPHLKEGNVPIDANQPLQTVWMLPGNFGGYTERTTTLPRNTGLFVPIGTGYACPPDCTDYASCASHYLEFTTTNLSYNCTLDDEPCLFKHHIVNAISPSFSINVAEGSALSNPGPQP